MLILEKKARDLMVPGRSLSHPMKNTMAFRVGD